LPETVFPCRDGRGRATEGELTSEVSKLDTASVMMMADVDHDKVGKLIRLLSDQDGEPLAAARALRGTLHRGGRDFHGLAERVSGASVRDEAATQRALHAAAKANRRADWHHRRADKLEADIADTEACLRALEGRVRDLELQLARVRIVAAIARRAAESPVNQPVQSGHVQPGHLSVTQRRHAIAEFLLGEGRRLSDREVARRFKCSPTTVGSIRKDLS
jgi:hypothetical protein